MWILHALTGQFPLIVGTVGEGMISLRRVKTGTVFEEPSVIAIEHREGRKYVLAVGSGVDPINDSTGVSVCEAFSSLEPLLTEFHVDAALLQHALREIFRAQILMAPKVVLRLQGRQSPLSDREKSALQHLAAYCGMARLYVFLDGQEMPDEKAMNHKNLSTSAHFVTRFRA